MKLIIGGSTGVLSTELIRHALVHPDITTIVGLGRRETTVPDGSADKDGKLRAVVCEDFGSYSSRVTKELEDADACIW
jgi:hypothetical protein